MKKAGSPTQGCEDTALRIYMESINRKGIFMKEYIVETASGKIRGYERNEQIEYLGIPYAQPPVG